MIEQLKRPALTRLLAIDTSTSAMTVAILDGRELLGESNVHTERNHSIRLLPTVRQLLHETGLKTTDLDGIAAGVGPGSYTGVRIGVTVAKTFAWSLRLPLIGISSLAALALGGLRHSEESEGVEHGTDAANMLEADVPGGGKIQNEDSWIVPLMDARRGQVFTGLYAVNVAAAGTAGFITGGNGNGDVPAGMIADGIRLMRDWVDRLLDRLDTEEPNRCKRVIFIGDIDLHREQIDRFIQEAGARVQVVVTGNRLQARDLGALAQKRWVNGEQDEVHRLVPNYTQLAEAEVKWLAKQKP